MKKQSIYFLYGIFSLVGIIVADLYITYEDWSEKFVSEAAFRADRLDSEAVQAAAFLKVTDSFDELRNLLEAKRKNQAIHFWAVFHGDELHEKDPGFLDFDNLRFRLNDHLVIQAMPDHVYATNDLGSGFVLLVGIRFDLALHFKEQFKARKGVFLKLYLLLGLAVFATFAYLFKDIMRSVRNLGQRGRKSFETGTKSKEAEMITRGFAAYENHASRLAEERDQLKWQVLPSLRTELQSGREPPYDFLCTLVRTDINNFSKIYNEFPVDEFTSTINDFFTDVSHVVSRYGGLIHEFIGDEVIFYFKDEDVGNSVAVALSAIRDINEIASEYNKRMLAERGYAFTVKSTFAHGSIRFRRFVNGFNLAGATLIETVRILSQVVEKSGNVVVFADRHLPLAEPISISTAYARVSLKGFSQEISLSQYLQHKPLSAFLSDREAHDLDDAFFYRSDAELEYFLDWIREHSTLKDAASVLKLIGTLRKFSVTRVSPRVMTALAELLEHLDSLFIEPNPQDLEESLLRIYSSSIRLIENLVPVENYDERFEHLLLQATQSDDRRVVANALDVLTRFRRESDGEFLDKLVKHDDNRVAANALVHEGQRHLSALVVRRLRRMLDTGKPTYTSSALYAIGELAAFHKAQDPIYYSTQLQFISLIHRLPEFLHHENVMVRRQALLAAKKSGEAEVLMAIRELSRGEISPALKLEMREYLGAEFLDSTGFKKAG
jgi:class 3 adenylate cyclase